MKAARFSAGLLATFAAFASLPLAAETIATGPAIAAPTVSLVGPALNVGDVERERRFLTDGLGMIQVTTLDVSGGRKEYIFAFNSDPGKAALMLMHDGKARRPAARRPGSGFDRVVVFVSDLDAIAARLRANGYAHDPIREANAMYRVMFLTDPENYRWELVQMRPRG